MWDIMLKKHYGRNGKCLFILATCVLIVCIVYLTNKTSLNIPQVNRVRNYIPVIRFISNEQRITIRPSEVKQDIEKFKRNHFMTVNGDGRLGNQMFQVASLIGTAFRYNYTPIIPPRYRLLNNSFDLLQPQDIHMNNAGIFHEEKSGTYDINIESLSYGKNWTLNGYFQSWKYFHNYIEKILALFKFNDRIKSKAIEVLKGLVTDGRTITKC
jgi:galactoside 2-L-fucosyltransferase 1/2